MKKRLIALLLVVLMLASNIPAVSAARSLWFIAVNDLIPMTMTSDTAPFYEDDVLYIPYSAFDVKPFGITSAYNPEKRETLTLFNRVKRLFYDLRNETCEDKEGNVSEVDIKFRGGVLFIPADCVDYFGCSVSLIENSSGYEVLRFTNGSQVYENDTFLARAEKNIQALVDKYDSGSSAPGDDDPDIRQPIDTNPPDPGVEPEGHTYLAFCGNAVSELSLKLLEEEGLRGAFFLTQTQIEENPALVRQLYAAGNTIGVTVSSNESDVQAALDAANTALDGAMFRKTLLALIPAEHAQGILGYRVLTMPELPEQSQDEPVEVDTPSFMVITEENIIDTILQLQTENIQILLLRENSLVA